MHIITILCTIISNRISIMIWPIPGPGFLVSYVVRGTFCQREITLLNNWKGVYIYHVGFYTKDRSKQSGKHFQRMHHSKHMFYTFHQYYNIVQCLSLTIIRGSEFSQTRSKLINIYSSNIPLSLKHIFVINIMLKFFVS